MFGLINPAKQRPAAILKGYILIYVCACVEFATVYRRVNGLRCLINLIEEIHRRRINLTHSFFYYLDI